MSKQKKGQKRKNNSATRLSEKRRAKQKAIDEERIANFIDFFGDIDFEYTGSTFLFFKDETAISAVPAHLFEQENIQNGRLATSLFNQIQVSGDDLISNERNKQKEIDHIRIENFKKQFPDTDFEFDGEEFSINDGMMSFSANMFNEQSYDQKEIDRIRIENFKKKFPDVEFEYDGEEFRIAGDPDDEFEFEKIKSKFPDVDFDCHEVEESPRDPSEDFNTVTSTIHLSADLFD